jgi:hypothetical protein
VQKTRKQMASAVLGAFDTAQSQGKIPHRAELPAEAALA